MAIRISVFIALFHMCRAVEALQKGSFDRNYRSGIGHGNFKPDLFQYLSTTVITSFSVKDVSECPFECIDEVSCFSFNIAVHPDSQGLYLCELLAADRYRARNQLQANDSFHHYSPWTPCYGDPCLNYGDCIPDFQMNSYHCVCKPGFNGTHCGACKFDFEDGIDGWKRTGTAFDNQPTYGDNPSARNRESAQQQGDWWIGGYENRPSKDKPAGRVQGDGPQGTLTSPPFIIRGKNISFLIGGGCALNVVRAELLVDNQIVRKATSDSCNETMSRKVWDVQEFIGHNARFRLVDFSSSGWGHINFDDLRGDLKCAGQK